MGSGLEVDRIDIATGQVDDLRIYGGRVYAVSQRILHVLKFEFGQLEQLATTGFSGDRNTNAPQRLRLFVGGDIAYVTHTRGYATIDVSDPANPLVIGNTITGQFGWKQVVANGNGLGFVAMSPNSTFDGPHNFAIYGIGNPAVTDNLVLPFETPGIARAVTIYNGIGYVADHTSGLHVVNYLAFDGQGEAPTVSITEPQSGSEVEEGSSFLVRVDVTDDVQVRNVEFYVDDLLVKTDGNFPFEVTLPAGSLNTTNSIEVVARASDTGGNASFSEPVILNLTPDSTPPRVDAVLPMDNGFVGETNGITLFFSEGIDPDSIGELSITLKGEGPDGLIGTTDDILLSGGRFTQSEDGSIVSYTQDETLDSGYFQIAVETSIADNIGNTLVKRFTSVFLALGDADTDRDGLADVIELNIGLDPNDPDSDDDGIFDGKEDNDSDGVTNDVEAFLGFDLAAVDSDLDGINDDKEDRDFDTVPDFKEVLAGSSINNIDSDSDGFSDDAEIISNSSPIDPLDIPNLFVVSNPLTSVLVLGSDSGVSSLSVTVAHPPVAVTVLSSELGDLPSSVTVARPPVNVLILSSLDAILPPNVTIATPRHCRWPGCTLTETNKPLLNIKSASTMTKNKSLILTGCLFFLGIITVAAQGFSFDSGSDGSFGAINVTEDTTIPLPPDGIINATTVTIAEGFVLDFLPNEFNTPVYLLTTGDVMIAGIVDVSGYAGNNTVGGVGGPGGFPGGNPGSFGVNPGDGEGPGAGKGGINSTAATGAGSGSYGNKGSNSYSGSNNKGDTYGSALLIPIIGGFGGGGSEGTPGFGGGGGGLIVASNNQIEVAATGIIHANGGPHAGSSRNGGSGGSVRLIAPKVLGAGKVNCVSLQTNRTLFGSNFSGYGRIRIDTIDRTELNLGFDPSGFTSVGANMVVFPSPLPRLDIAEVAGTNVTLGTSNSVFVDLPFNADPNRTVTVRAQDFGKIVNIAVVLQPVNGDRIIYEDSIDNSANNPATKIINVVFPVNTQTKVFVWTRPDA